MPKTRPEVGKSAQGRLDERIGLLSAIDCAGLPVQHTGKPAKCIIRSRHAELGTQESGAGLVQSLRRAAEPPLNGHWSATELHFGTGFRDANPCFISMSAFCPETYPFGDSEELARST